MCFNFIISFFKWLYSGNEPSLIDEQANDDFNDLNEKMVIIELLSSYDD